MSTQEGEHLLNFWHYHQGRIRTELSIGIREIWGTNSDSDRFFSEMMKKCGFFFDFRVTSGSQGNTKSTIVKRIRIRKRPISTRMRLQKKISVQLSRTYTSLSRILIFKYNLLLSFTFLRVCMQFGRLSHSITFVDNPQWIRYGIHGHIYSGYTPPSTAR